MTTTAKKASERWKNVTFLYEKGMTYKEIAKKVGDSPGAINNILCAYRKGFDSVGAYKNHLARERGFKNHFEYQKLTAAISPSRYPSFSRKKRNSWKPRNSQKRETQKKFHWREYLEEENLETFIENIEAHEYVHNMLLELEQKDKKKSEIIRARFLEGKTLEAIAQSRGITKQRVEQLEKEGLAKLRYYVRWNIMPD